MSEDEEREKRKKKYNLIRPSLSKYANGWDQAHRIEKDLVNLHQLYDVEGYQSTACPRTVDIKSNAELLKIQSQALSQTPENVKSRDKDGGVECVTGCIGACCLVTGHSFKNCQEAVFETDTSKSEDNGRYHYPTREEKLEALWIKENGNVIRDRVHSSPGLPLVCQLTNALRQTLLLCSVSEGTCGRPLLHVNNESELAVIIMEGIKELACKDDQRAIDRFQHILKESLAICNEMIEVDGEESSDQTLQFFKSLLDVIACMRSQRNNNSSFDKIRNNLRNNGRPALLDDNAIHKRHNVEILNKIINSDILETTSEKKEREYLTALQLEFKEERVSVGILSAIAIKEQSLLLKEMKVFPHQLYETKVPFTSTATGARGIYGKKRKKMKLSRVTREIRARMKKRAELEREEWIEESCDENN